MKNKELSNIIKMISSWYSKRVKVLSIKSRPYNTLEILFSTIYKVINNGDKVLYVWSFKDKKNEKQNKLIEDVLKYSKKDRLLENIKFITIDEIQSEEDSYNLVIFDDISFFSKESIESLRAAVEEIYWRSMKILIYSSEYIFPIGEKIEVPYLNTEIPMIEPRIINTRIRLDEDIPLALFEYYKWFGENKKNVLVIVPSSTKLNKVYEKYREMLTAKGIRVMKHHNNQSLQNILRFVDLKEESVFIITNNVNEYISTLRDISVVLLFADDIFYNYKKILNICAAVNCDENKLSEVLLVSKEESEDIDKARAIIRGFNKRLWEKNIKK